MRPLTILISACVPTLIGCSFCANWADQPSLRLLLAKSALVQVGRVHSATIDADGSNGQTELDPVELVKGVAPVKTRLKRYLPVEPGAIDLVVIFAASAEKASEPEWIVPATPGLIAMLKSLHAAPPGSPLGFAFRHLDHADEAVRQEAFGEFARATDAEVQAAKAEFSPERLRELLAASDPARRGVFAVLLGHVARPADADHLAAMAKPGEPALGGVLAGLALADPERGWQRIRAAVLDGSQTYTERFAAINAGRFVAGLNPADRPRAKALAVELLKVSEFADTAIEDLRRAEAWDTTPQVVAASRLPGHQGRLVRRAVVEFLLDSPHPEAAPHVEAMRGADARLVASVEAGRSPKSP